MYMDKVPQRDELEFTKMRYTAITCDPNDFVVCPSSRDLLQRSPPGRPIHFEAEIIRPTKADGAVHRKLAFS